MSFQIKYRKFGKTCTLSPKPNLPVYENLAITPSKMAQLVDEGIPVSSSVMSGVAFDGVSNPSWDVPIERLRGVDVAAVWNAQKSARKNITNGVSLKSDSHAE
ncbi:hypothetical protein [Sigmofec virus UA08Rod_4687]|uniref:Uncharacterized protein n=1 Tax=Sigmofec virus UA08Rod_4687 TaxID=2929407 RepID=A0A976N1D2_9VIRU|nr:hypothetical protein [Sigmofec virus UA08Rod_4687]